LAILFATGGELGIPEFSSYDSNGIYCVTNYKRSGSYSIRFYSGSATQVIPSTTELYISGWFYFTWLSGGTIELIKLRGGGTTNVALRTSPGNPLWLYDPKTITILASGSTTLTLNTWYLIELHIRIGVNGLVECRLNGLPEFSYSGNTTNTPFIDGVYMDASSVNYYLDDFIINDTTGSINNSWMGGCKIVTLRPIGAGSSTQWIPSAGSNWDCVDETPPSATDYISSTTAGALDLYDIAPLPDGVSSSATIRSVIVTALAQRAGLSTSYFYDAIRINGSNYFSPLYGTGPVYSPFSYIMDLNPATGVTWLFSEVNTIEAGVKLF
jgi:hypothetical protein